MSNPTDEERDRYIRAYQARRRAKCKRSERGWIGDIGSGLVAGIVGLSVSSSDETLGKVLIGAASGLVGGAIWHYGVMRAIRFVWTVPEEEHVSQQLKIHELEEQIRESAVNKSLASQKILDHLATLHVEGVEIKARILEQRKTWDEALGPVAKDWNAKVRDSLTQNAGHLAGRFVVDDADHTLDARRRWSQYMTLRLKGLQSVIDSIRDQS
jgi:hypothetical protein